MKLGDFDITVLTVKDMPEDEMHFVQPTGVELKDGKIVCTYKVMGRIVNIGGLCEEKNE